MSTLVTSSKPLSALRADALVLAVAAASPDTAPEPRASGARVLGVDGLPPRLRDALGSSEALAALGVSGRPDQVVRIPSGGDVAAPVLVLVGLGPVVTDLPTPDALRRAAGAAVRQLAGTASVALALPTSDVERAAAVAEGALLGAYSFTAYRSGEPGGKAPVAALTVMSSVADSRELAARVERAHVVAEGVALTRDLVNTPPLDLFPEAFAQAAADAAGSLPVTVTVLDDAELLAGGYGGLTGVGQGSSRGPRLVKVDYAPRDATVHVALVGKGITFDSGGLSLKPPTAMETMKSDMAGAAAVLGAVCALARLGVPARVTGWLALAENMPSGTAIRPSDVLTMRGGRTVEVLNTDAEGRLVLADALVAAGEDGPDAVVDVATLTGAQLVALGDRVSAVMAEDAGFAARVLNAASRAGEELWPMPLPEDLRTGLESTIADVRSTAAGREGGMLTAGLFLRDFVPRLPVGSGRRRSAAPDGPRVPWAHLDIAGPSFTTGKGHGPTGPGGTGVAVATLVALVEDLAER